MRERRVSIGGSTGTGALVPWLWPWLWQCDGAERDGRQRTLEQLSAEHEHRLECGHGGAEGRLGNGALERQRVEHLLKLSKVKLTAPVLVEDFEELVRLRQRGIRHRDQTQGSDTVLSR